MIGVLKPYPAMKRAGVKWLGDVPAHWEVRRLRNLTRILFSNVDKHSKDDETTVRLCNYLDVYHNDRIRSDMDFMKATATTEEIDRFALVVGDVLITKDSESWDDIGVPAFVESTDHDLVCGYHLALLRPIHGNFFGKFLYRALSCRGVANQLYIRANGVTRFGLSQTAIKSIWLPVPDLTEQTAIVRFLDHADRRIQRYIRDKEKLIALLGEQKQAIVHQAVTGRIDVRTGRPYPAYKPPGVEWLGEVPARWQVISLGMISLSIQTGPFGSQLHASDYVDDGIPVINPSNIRDGSIHANNRISVTEGTAKRLSGHILQPGDIVMARRGELGRCALVSNVEKGWLCGTGNLRIRLKPNTLSPPYLILLLNFRSVRDTLHLSSIGATMENLNTGMVARLRIFYPSLTEQENIVNYVNETTTKINGGIARARRERA